jgi:hypothetical protein
MLAAGGFSDKEGPPGGPSRGTEGSRRRVRLSGKDVKFRAGGIGEHAGQAGEALREVSTEVTLLRVCVGGLPAARSRFATPVGESESR